MLLVGDPCWDSVVADKAKDQDFQKKDQDITA
jgi:hypothetical protein